MIPLCLCVYILDHFLGRAEEGDHENGYSDIRFFSYMYILYADPKLHVG